MHTYDDLAALSVGDIEAQFKKKNKPYSRREIEICSQETTKLTTYKAKQNTKTTVESFTSESDYSPENENSDNEFPAKVAQVGYWNPVATFIVEFQVRQTEEQVVKKRIKINYHDTDRDIIWPGIKREGIN